MCSLWVFGCFNFFLDPKQPLGGPGPETIHQLKCGFKIVGFLVVLCCLSSIFELIVVLGERVGFVLLRACSINLGSSLVSQ